MPPSGRHVAIIAPPTPGHLNPLQALGTELAAVGHRVTVVHLGDAAPLVTQPRIGFARVETPDVPPGFLSHYLARLADPTGPVGLTRMIRAAAAMTRMLLDGAPAALERIGADAVIADAAEPAGPLLAQRMRVPHIISVTGLPLLRERDVPPPFTGWRYRADLLGRIRNWGGHAVADRLLQPITRVLARCRAEWRLDEVEEAPPLHVAQCPRGLDFPRVALPARFTYGAPWRSPSAGDVELPAGIPLVFCSLGTLQGARRALFAKMAAACAAVGARAVIGHGGGLTPAEAAALPGDPLVRAFWPQELVLRRCAAAVLHGGFNSVLDALAAGVPIVALPIAFEQPGTAARLARVGAGKVLAPRRLTAGTLAGALRDVMRQPAYRAAALRLSAEMEAAGGAPRAAARVSSALAGHA